MFLSIVRYFVNGETERKLMFNPFESEKRETEMLIL